MKVLLSDAVKDYDTCRVLDIGSLEFTKGIYAILGSNGSGKSTLMSCMAGLECLSEGSILYDGRKLDANLRNSISILVQKPYLFNKTSYENIVSGLKYKRTPKEELQKRFDKYKSYFEVDDLLNKKSSWLSGGERAKIALLRTAVLETELTMLDEPTAAMDIESSMRAENLIRQMAENNRTVILITHDVHQAKRIADQVIFMDKGKIIEMGKAENVLNNPANKLVRQILNI
ncbi:MAG: ATP-binding cassette domain-containing protein [Sedimentibacter sp.]|uniref:ATP-binding cassette domain-containing protein n=1 Tax=Sedimentibacter sp. TaxID=1960295 RepID=UPI0031588564